MSHVRKDSILAKAGEILAFPLAIGAANYFYPQNPGFFGGFFNPYLTLSLFLSVYYGKYYGFLSLGFSCLVVALGLPTAASVISGGALAIPFELWERLWQLAPIPLAITLVEIYLLGLMRDSLVKRESRSRMRLASFSRDKGLLTRQVRALQSANFELEERISRQEDSITSLYSQVQALHSLNLAKAFQSILEMVRRFVGATRVSIWEHKPEANRLELAASLGWEESSDARTVIQDENTIEGWVVRNNLMFSVKMVLENELLHRMDTGRNIMTLPIAAGRRIWGVLNVEEMPFAKYNLYTDRLLPMIMTLAGPALERAIEFESVLRQEDIHPLTGIPSFSQFYALLARELPRLAVENGTLAVVILELLNFPKLLEEHGREASFHLIVEVARIVQELSGGHARLFHYKSESQLALLYPNLDSDGASLFSLNLLEKVNSTEWRVRDARTFIELILGFSVRTASNQSPDDLLDSAANLLEMQKV